MNPGDKVRAIHPTPLFTFDGSIIAIANTIDIFEFVEDLNALGWIELRGMVNGKERTCWGNDWEFELV